MEKLLTVAEAAPLLRLSRQAAYAVIRAGLIPVVRVSQRRIRLDPRAIREWIESQTQKNGAQNQDNSSIATP
jgi:excisionase family DNA binding protein